ncbi:hypothetical protein COCVIDRAFT_100013 [Bipolaris victoriae FI3]|uniref:Uncharacterized protein n=1 Tax=Bipolaris victoriae (strain FI3) TaxID=930091 RepID=W7EF00_BIPV3|nr:hypothetical protein COCVIDRAFT_100013 [Bipolaris victoriae FI3]
MHLLLRNVGRANGPSPGGAWNSIRIYTSDGSGEKKPTHPQWIPSPPKLFGCERKFLSRLRV